MTFGVSVESGVLFGLSVCRDESRAMSMPDRIPPGYELGQEGRKRSRGVKVGRGLGLGGSSYRASKDRKHLVDSC